MSRGKLDDDFLNKDTKLQMQQKIIYYRSEIITFQNKLKKLEQDLEKEKIRNQYLQEKLFEAENKNLESYEKEITSLKMKLLANEVALEEEKKRVKSIQEKLLLSTQAEKQKVEVEPKPFSALQSYFSYSFLYTHEEEDIEVETNASNISIIGDCIIENYGTTELHQPILCIRITPNLAGQISGKIATNKLQVNDHSDENLPQDEWQFVHDDWKDKIKKNGEYWIKPTKVSIIRPKEKLIFSNFELTLRNPIQHRSIIVEAFSYCQEFKNGIPALNKIIINL